MDVAKLLRFNFGNLAAAGCKNIQIDEPFFTMSDEEEVEAAVEAINLAIEGPPARRARLHAYLPRQLCRRQGI